MSHTLCISNNSSSATQSLTIHSGWSKELARTVIPAAASAVSAVFVCMMRSLSVSLHYAPFFPAWLPEHLQGFVLDVVLWLPWELTSYTAFFLKVLDESQIVLVELS